MLQKWNQNKNERNNSQLKNNISNAAKFLGTQKISGNISELTMGMKDAAALQENNFVDQASLMTAS